MNADKPAINQKANDIKDTLEYLVSNYPKKSKNMMVKESALAL